MGYVIAFVGLHRHDVPAPRRHPGEAGMRASALPRRPRGRGGGRRPAAGGPARPDRRVGQYALHVLIQIFIWSFIGQAWSLMGRFGLVSLGHGAFLGLGAYTVALLWNFFGLTPWIGAVVAVAGTAAVRRGRRVPVLPLPRGRPLLRPRDAGGGRGGPPADHRRARLDGRLARAHAQDGRREQPAGDPVRRPAGLLLRRPGRSGWRGLWVWRRLDRSMARSAMEAIGEDETAAASVGIHVTRFKIGITVLSAALTALGRRRVRAVHHVREPGDPVRDRRVAPDRLRRRAGRDVRRSSGRPSAPR